MPRPHANRMHAAWKLDGTLHDVFMAVSWLACLYWVVFDPTQRPTSHIRSVGGHLVCHCLQTVVNIDPAITSPPGCLILQ